MSELFAMDAPAARRAIRRIAFDQAVDLKARLRALVELLDRAFGRPITPTEITGRDGQLRALGAPRDAAEELVIA